MKEEDISDYLWLKYLLPILYQSRWWIFVAAYVKNDFLGLSNFHTLIDDFL